MQMRVLGPIEVATGAGGLVPLSGQRQRALLAGLVLEHGRVVPVGRLVDILWDTDPPPTARAKVQGHVSALRQVLRIASPGPAELIATRPPGYQFNLAGAALDLHDFEALTDRGRRAALRGDALSAASLFAGALRLWRGAAFADVASPIIRAAAAVLEERRLLAVEGKAEADLASGQREAVVAELGSWLAEYPLRERLRALAMVALYRLGCRADALRLYREGRRLMIAELGLEPGPQLRDLHQRILAEDSALRRVPGVAGPGSVPVRDR